MLIKIGRGARAASKYLMGEVVAKISRMRKNNNVLTTFRMNDAVTDETTIRGHATPDHDKTQTLSHHQIIDSVECNYFAILQIMEVLCLSTSSTVVLG
jgi:hypothetical protein